MNFLILPRERGEEDIIKAMRLIESLPANKAWSIEVKEHKRKRSEQQNRYLWGVCYATILKQGGEALGGFRDTDLHELLLGEWSGWQTLEAFGKKRQRPMKRSATLNKQDFSDYVMFIQHRAANMGIVIPDPDEYLVP